MKITAATLFLLLFFACTNGETEPADRIDIELEEPDANPEPSTTDLSENAVEAGSQKALLIGDWQDANDPELMLSINADKFSTYVNGEKNWDNPWDLSNYIEYAPENEDDNGDYVLVHLEDKSAVFYAQKIISLTENQLEVEIVKSSAGTGMTQTFIRN
jgi:hypothetical protein